MGVTYNTQLIASAASGKTVTWSLAEGSSGSITKSDSTLTVEPSSASSTYGETLTIKVTPERSAANSINALTEQDTVELLTSEGTARRTASRSQ